jgi:hypothetical protein
VHRILVSYPLYCLLVLSIFFQFLTAAYHLDLFPINLLPCLPIHSKLAQLANHLRLAAIYHDECCVGLADCRAAERKSKSFTRSGRNSRQHHNVATIVREEDDRKMGWTGGVPAREQASGISVIFFLWFLGTSPGLHSQIAGESGYKTVK